MVIWDQASIARAVIAPAKEKLDLYIPFTTPALTQAAVTAAEKLAQGLDAEIHVVYVLRVSVYVPLQEPHVALEHIHRCLQELKSERRVLGHVYVTREPDQTLESLITDNAVVVIAARKRFWTTHEERLARAYSHRGREVVLVLV